MCSLDFGLSVTNKAHIVFAHLADVLDKRQEALGQWSEEVVEACHQAFDKVWQRYKVKNVASENHGKNLYRAVLEFNAFNV